MRCGPFATRGRCSQMQSGGLWLALLLMWLAGCSSPDGLEVGLIGCDAVLRGPVCVLAQQREVRLLVKTGIGSKLILEDASGPVPFQCDDAPAGSAPCLATREETLLRLQRAAKPSRLRLGASQPGHLGCRSVELRIEPQPPLPEWLVAAKKARKDSDRPQDSEKIVRKVLAEGSDLPVSLKALAYSELARALNEQLRFKEAEKIIQHAIALEQEAGLSSLQSEDLFFLADILYDQRHLLRTEQLLDQNEPLFHTVAGDLPWLALYKAQARQAMGDTERALQYLDNAEHWNACCGELRSESMAKVLRTSVYVEIGRAPANRFIEQAAERLSAFPCRHGLLLRRQALMRIHLLESISGEVMEQTPESEARLAALWKQWETDGAPGSIELHGGRIRSILDRSMAAFTGRDAPPGARKCDLPRHITLVRMTQARLAVLMGRWQDGKALLEDVKARLALLNVHPDRDPPFSIDWNRLMAHVLRAEGKYKEALDRADQIERYAGDDVGSFEVRWSARMARAQALLGLGEERRSEALAALQGAQDILEEASRSAPQFLGRGPLLGRFEWGMRLFLEQQLRIDETGAVRANKQEKLDALRLIRHGRTRGLRELRTLERLRNLSPSEKQSWDQAVSAYLAARNEGDLAFKPAKRVEALEEGARKRLAQALQVLSENEIPSTQRPPGAGEVFLACHPLRRRWVCLAADAEDVNAVTLDASDFGLPRPQLAQKLLSPFEAQLTRAQRVFVFSYGLMRNVAVHLLPFEGKTLGSRRAVRYPLDLSSTQTKAPDSRRLAMVVVDRQLEKEGGVEVAGPAMSLLSQRRWSPQLYEMEYHGALEVAAPTPILSELRQKSQRVGLLQWFGHADYSSENGWIHGVWLSPWRKLTAGDVLVLPDVPGLVILIACQSGASQDLSGGQEALGLAQAFLLRGSREVLATTRKVTATAGGMVSRAVHEHLAAQPNASLAEALSVALERLSLPGDANVEVEEDGTTRTHNELLRRIAPELDAFRVLEP